MTTAIMVTAGITQMVKLTDAWNSMGAIITVDSKPICVRILVKHSMEAVIPN